MKKLLALACLSLTVAACNRQQQKPAVASPPSPSVAASTTPAHRYLEEDNREYSYASPPTEEEKKQGKVAGAVVQFRYIGNTDGAATVEVVNGATSELYSCTEPCNQVKKRVLEGADEKSSVMVDETPDTPVGAALRDALNGQLKPYEAPDTSRAKGAL